MSTKEKLISSSMVKIKNEEKKPSVTVAFCFEPVSYTHLEVYRRQVQERAVRRLRQRCFLRRSAATRRTLDASSPLPRRCRAPKQTADACPLAGTDRLSRPHPLGHRPAVAAGRARPHSRAGRGRGRRSDRAPDDAGGFRHLSLIHI